jgi:excinuclease ABC subunit B
VGINLLREGLDLPEVSLVCILDADKEGFLRNETSLIQTAGRAARHISGECVLFCDVVTDSIQALLDVSNRRRARQQAYNETHGITPQGVKRAVQQSLHTHEAELEEAEKLNRSLVADDVETYDKIRVIAELEEEMREASSRLEFERAAHLRDQIAALKNPTGTPERKPVKYPAGKTSRGKRASS